LRKTAGEANLPGSPKPGSARARAPSIRSKASPNQERFRRHLMVEAHLAIAD
jgi:hypothetical protein